MSSQDAHIILETPRLILRQFTEADVDNLFNLNSDPEVMRYLTGGRPKPREDIRDQILPLPLAVYRRLDRPGPGSATTNNGLGYRLPRPAWNKGYATEGSRGVIDLGFSELGVERVFAH